MIDLIGSTVLVTGGSSMIGRGIIKSLNNRKCKILAPTHQSLDLLCYLDVYKYIYSYKPDFIIHAAGYNGNISFNKLYPQDIFYKTTIMGLNILLAASQNNIKKIVSILTSCAYRSTNFDLFEDDFLNGIPDETVEAHGLAKRNLFIMSKQTVKQADNTNAVCGVFNTAYGPYDNFAIDKTKVVGGLINKFVTAAQSKRKKVVCWGTGQPTRELIYCEDASEGIVQILEKYDDSQSIMNIGFEEEISIKQLSEKIAFYAGFDGIIEWDTTKPDGQMRKMLNTSKMKKYNIQINKTSLDEGLKKTIDWYKKHENNDY